MEKIRLKTKKGEYVTTGLIPPFLEWPEVVIWGERVFQLVSVIPEDQMTTYRECFTVAVVAQTTDP